MTEFNIRTTINHRLRQDALTTQSRSRMACQRMEYRHRQVALRHAFCTVAVDAALIGSIVTAAVVMVVCAII